MNAAIQRCVVGVAATAMLAVTLWCAWSKSPKVASAIVAALVLGHGIVLGAEFALMCIVNRDGDIARPTFGQVLRAWWKEALLAIKVFAWRQPFRANAVSDFVPATRTGARGTILLHGYACNRGIWTAWLARLRRQSVPVIALNLEPPWASIDAYAPQIEKAVAAMELATGEPPILVAHSMGGLAARHWYSSQQNPTRIHHLVMIGSPNRGTWLARFALGFNGRQMRQSSKFLKALAASETSSHRERMTCFYSHCDNIVFPTVNATLDGTDNRHVEGCAHVQLIEHKACWAALQDLLPSVQTDIR